jgi:hypothetical protein
MSLLSTPLSRIRSSAAARIDRHSAKCSASDALALSSVSESSAASDPSSQPHKPLRNTQRWTMASRH